MIEMILGEVFGLVVFLGICFGAALVLEDFFEWMFK